jgi:hypothetical protein
MAMAMKAIVETGKVKIPESGKTRTNSAPRARAMNRITFQNAPPTK